MTLHVRPESQTQKLLHCTLVRYQLLLGLAFGGVCNKLSVITIVNINTTDLIKKLSIEVYSLELEPDSTVYDVKI